MSLGKWKAGDGKALISQRAAAGLVFCSLSVYRFGPGEWDGYSFVLTPSLLCAACSVDPNDQKKTACYDIDVEVDDPLKAQMSNFLASTTNQQEIASLDVKVGLLSPHPPLGPTMGVGRLCRAFLYT